MKLRSKAFKHSLTSVRRAGPKIQRRDSFNACLASVTLAKVATVQLFDDLTFPCPTLFKNWPAYLAASWLAIQSWRSPALHRWQKRRAERSVFSATENISDCCARRGLQLFSFRPI